MSGTTYLYHQNTFNNTGNGTTSYYFCGDSPTFPNPSIPSTDDQSVVADVADVHFKGPRESVSTFNVAATSVLDKNNNSDMKLNPPAEVRIQRR